MNYLFISKPDEMDFVLLVHYQQLFGALHPNRSICPSQFLLATLLATFETKFIVDNTEHGRLVNTDFSRYLAHGTTSQ